MTHRTPLAALAVLVASSTLPVAAQSMHSGSFITCVVPRTCTRQTIDGKQYFVVETSQLVVRVSIDADGKYNRASVQLENRASYDVQVSPADFRIEVTAPKFRRLSYIEPGQLHLPKPKAVKPAAPKLGSSFVSAHPSEAAAGTNFLTPAKLAPASIATGQVYFERGNGAAQSLLMPIAGAIYEFPYKPSK